MLTKNAISNMQNRYIAVLKKCRLLNAFGSLAVVSMLAMGACGMVGAEGVVNDAWAGDITDNNISDNIYYINGATQTGSINVSGDLSFFVSGNSSYTVDSKSTISGSLTLKGNDSDTLEFTVASTLSVSGTTTIESGGSLTVKSDGIYNVGSNDASWITGKLAAFNPTAADYAILAIYAANSISSSGTLTVGNSTSTSNMNFGNNSLLVVNASLLRTYYALSADTIYVDSGASLLVSNVTFSDEEATITVNIASANISLTIESGAWGYDGHKSDGTASSRDLTNSDNVYFDNALIQVASYSYDNNSGGTYSLTLSKDAARTRLPLLDKSLSDHIDSATTLPDFINDAFDTISDEKKAAATIEGAAKMSICAGILTSLASLDGLGASAVQARSSFKGAANMSTSTISQKDAFLASNNGSFSDTPVPVISDAGTAGGMLNGFALWLQPTYKSLSADGLTSGNFEYGYDTTILGVSLGADYTVGNSLRFGLAFHSGNGETESSSDSDFNYTEDDFEYAGLTFYSAYVHNNLSLALDMGYIATTNSVTQQTTIGNLYTGDFTAGVLCLGLRSEYKIATSFLDLIPYMGARFNYFEIESFDTKDNNGIVYENKASYASTFGIPIGINVTKAFVDDGVTYTPRASLGMQFTMGDLDVEQRVSIPSVGGHARMENEIFDPVTFMGGIGLGVAKDNVTFALDYSIGASEHTTSHQVMATFGYRF